MLEEVIASFIIHMSQNYKKYLGAFLGFLVAILWLQFGFLEMLFVFVCIFIGSRLGDVKLQKKIKRKILERLKED